MPDDDHWSAGMLLWWVLTHDIDAVLSMVNQYGGWRVNGEAVTRLRPQTWDDVTRLYTIDDSLPKNKRAKEGVRKAILFVLPAIDKIYAALRRCRAIDSWARPNGSGDIVKISPMQWAGLRLRCVDGHDIAVPIDSEGDPLILPRPVVDYLSGTVPVSTTPTVWPDPLFSAEQAMRLWPPNESGIVNTRSLSSELGERAEEAPVRPPQVCIEQDLRATYVRRVAEFQKAHRGRNPPVQTTKDGTEGDREWATRTGISRGEITRFRRQLLKTTIGRPPAENSAENSAEN